MMDFMIDSPVAKLSDIQGRSSVTYSFSGFRNLLSIMTLMLMAPVLSGCASAVIGGAATVGVAAYQERGVEQAARDFKHATQIRANYLNKNSDRHGSNRDYHSWTHRELVRPEQRS